MQTDSLTSDASDERSRAMLHDLIIAVLEERETREDEPVPSAISVSEWQKALIKAKTPNVRLISSPDSRALAAALESALNWLYARDMGTHIKIGVPQKSGFSAEYVNDINTVRRGVELARRLGRKFKSLEVT